MNLPYRRPSERMWWFIDRNFVRVSSDSAAGARVEHQQINPPDAVWFHFRSSTRFTENHIPFQVETCLHTYRTHVRLKLYLLSIRGSTRL